MKMTEQEKILKREAKKKEQKSESQLVHEYVNKVIRGKQSRGHVDKRFDYTKADGAVNKDMWMDTDFFFSVVFQSADQKDEFLKRIGWALDNLPGSQVQIVNGLKLAEQMKIPLKRESAREYPYGSLDLRPFVLDDEAL